jgi:hypothetical protein
MVEIQEIHNKELPVILICGAARGTVVIVDRDLPRTAEEGHGLFG